MGDRVWGDWSAMPDREEPATAERRQLANRIEGITAQLKRGDQTDAIAQGLEDAAKQARVIGDKER